MYTTHDTSPSRREFESFHGYWNTDLEDLLLADPRYFGAYDRLLRVTSIRGNLTPLERELICIAVTGQVTYLDRAATAHHIRQATHWGASSEEIVETLQLAASLGVHSMLVGVPLAHEVFQKLGVSASASDEDWDDYRRDLKERFIADRKYWTPHWDTVLAYTPEYFEAYLDLSSIPWNHGTLSDAFKELIYVAIDVVTTHLFTAGIHTHTKKAIEYGATPDQVIDVMAIASNIGIDTVLAGVPRIPRDVRPR
ncbi:carboxymuconolactone decarboxylase family protein [Dietzia natronolimnaea]|uniref:carboxymuconolactone decarboxylase family protein n=1 Tax=Dietzia natronolimnaea TaxID=161920 RepID=UPI0015F89E7F|nr:carboxymuconolactone decarboxylase family protein [Dietzia natronolimnaea]MBB1037669.1 carboxymuconolactone decarboxylase [Dietzia natronolimnaea]